MAVRIQIRRDTSANWSANNPVLYPGEIGFETDTKKFKIGPAVTSPTVATAWNSITAYANVVPSDLSNTLNDYILAADLGVADGPAKLDVDGNLLIPEDSIIFEGSSADAHETTLTVTNPTADRTITLPDVTGTIVTTGDTGSVTNTMLAGSIANEKLTNSAITINGTSTSLGGTATLYTDDITEDGSPTNLWFTDERAQDAIAAALAAGTHTNITVTYNDNSNSLSLAAAPGYTNEEAVDAVAAALAAGSHTNISVSYDDNGNAISLTGAVTYTDENAQDAIGNALGTGLSYNDTTGAISVDTATIQARVADVSDTEIGYLNGVTSSIQTQIDAKLASATASSTYAPINNPTFTGTVTLPGNPSTANEAATKSYVDNISAGLNFHAAVHAATTADLSATYDNGAKTLSASGAFPQIDGHTINETERVLVKSQTNAVQNGIYTLTDDGDPSGTWVLTRASDADNSPAGEIAYGDFTFVQNGTLNGGQGFIMTTTGTITLGTSNIVFTQFNTGQSVVAGNGLSEATPGTLSINTAITADLSTAQTFTNKTLTSPKINENVVLTATATELNYVDGVTSAIQTQLDAKIAKSDISAKGAILVGTGSGTYTAQIVGTNGQVLTANSVQADGVEWTTLPTTSSTTAITSNSAVTVDTVAITSFVSIEYQLTIKQQSSIRSSKVLVQTDGSSVDYSEYGIVTTGTAIPGVTVAASTSSTNMILQVTVSNAATTTARAFIVKNTIIGTTPDAPTIGTATGGVENASVTFTAPTDNGGSAITSYTVTSNPGAITGSGSSSPVTVSGLTGGTSYTFTVTATNANGTSAASSASNSVTPTAAPIQAGYFGGGDNNNFGQTTVDKFVFSNDSRSTLATGLSSARRSGAGMANSGTAGYFGGGSNGPAYTTVDKFDFSNDSRTTLATGLSAAQDSLAAMANSGTAGYLGNRNGTVDKFAFSNDSRSTLASSGRAGSSGMANSGTAGYFGGGSNSTTVDKFDFSNDSRTTLATGLSSEREFTGAMANSGTAGYFGGGWQSTSIVNKFAFSNDSRTTLATGLSSSRIGPSGMAKSGTAGYIGGGSTGSRVTTVDKFAFSDDSRTTLATGLSLAVVYGSAMANSGVL